MQVALECGDQERLVGEAAAVSVLRREQPCDGDGGRSGVGVMASGGRSSVG